MWEGLEFRVDVLLASQAAQTELRCMYQTKLFLPLSCKFIIFNFIIKLVKNFWLT
jgi:hypothetical protein